ncbi:MAG: ribose-phosphate diphosphokinase [Salinirussus sp.]
MILAGSASQGLAAALAARTTHDLADVEYHRFPDGETKVRIGEPVERAVIVGSTVSDRAYIEILQLQDAAREAGAKKVTTVLPYMGYARQDRAFEPGEPVSARAIARAVSTGTDRVLTVNPHELAVCDFFDVAAKAVEGAGRLAEGLPAGLEEPLFLSPDAGGIGVAQAIRDAYGTGSVDNFEKRRRGDEDVELTADSVDIAGRDVVLADDIIATGSTMAQAAGVLSDGEAAGIWVACVHALLVGNARTRLERANVDRLIATDTIEQSVSAVSVAPAIADAL